MAINTELDHRYILAAMRAAACAVAFSTVVAGGPALGGCRSHEHSAKQATRETADAENMAAAKLARELLDTLKAEPTRDRKEHLRTLREEFARRGATAVLWLDRQLQICEPESHREYRLLRALDELTGVAGTESALRRRAFRGRFDTGAIHALQLLGRDRLLQPLSDGEVDLLIGYLQQRDLPLPYAAAQVLGRNHAGRGLGSTIARYKAEVARAGEGNNQGIYPGAWLSAGVTELYGFLSAFEGFGSSAVARLRTEREKAVAPEIHRWLTLAAAAAGDASVVDEVRAIAASDIDSSTRCVSLRVLSKRAPAAAKAILERIDPSDPKHAQGSPLQPTTQHPPDDVAVLWACKMSLLRQLENQENMKP